MKLFKQIKNLFPFLAFFISSCFFAEPQYIKLTDTFDVDIQPIEALKIAEPYIEKHATYNWNKDKPLKTHIIKYRKWYYFKRTNYPAKAIRYYMQPAVRVNVNNGEISFVEKK
ncbi:MAG: hypothetical protein JXR51_00365 [Bacteroidales bacterium]|nr:hypothetical protein [Bacteroidales bacterium]MBN2755593.1 hypothetical protein [Bacteroidales bacterium]